VPVGAVGAATAKITNLPSGDSGENDNNEEERRRSDSESRGWPESCGGVVETGGGCER
jgi:hypothetical protein